MFKGRAIIFFVYTQTRKLKRIIYYKYGRQKQSILLRENWHPFDRVSTRRRNRIGVYCTGPPARATFEKRFPGNIISAHNIKCNIF